MNTVELIAKKLRGTFTNTDLIIVELEKHPGLSSRQFCGAVKDKLPSNWGLSHVHQTLLRLARTGRAERKRQITSDTARKAWHFFPK